MRRIADLEQLAGDQALAIRASKKRKAGADRADGSSPVGSERATVGPLL